MKELEKHYKQVTTALALGGVSISIQEVIIENNYSLLWRYMGDAANKNQLYDPTLRQAKVVGVSARGKAAAFKELKNGIVSGQIVLASSVQELDRRSLCTELSHIEERSIKKKAGDDKFNYSGKSNRHNDDQVHALISFLLHQSKKRGRFNSTPASELHSGYAQSVHAGRCAEKAIDDLFRRS